VKRRPRSYELVRMVFFVSGADGCRVEEATNRVRDATATGHGRGDGGCGHDGRVVVDGGRVAHRVQAHVVVVAGRRAEQLSTPSARAVVLTCVSALDVVVEGGALRETGTAFAALKGPLARVQPGVVLQAKFALERLAAQPAQQGPTSWVVVHVVRQRWSVREAKPAHLMTIKSRFFVFKIF
jgi:hypothetical protein